VTFARHLRWAGLCLAVVLLLAYLREPPWTPHVTSGLSRWETDEDGVRFRWTSGRASFFVPSSARKVTIPLRAVPASGDARPFVVDIWIDGRLADRVVLADGSWVTAVERPVPRPRGRRFRRIDLRVDRAWGDWRRGVRVGDIEASD